MPLNATENLALGERVIAHAQLMIADQAVDYIYLRPGEREIIQIIVNLDGVGRYKVTPIINYAFQDKNSSLAMGASVVVFPEYYRYWNAEYNGPVKSNDMLPVGNIILNTKALDFNQPNPIPYAQQACFDLNKWIAFVSMLSKDDQRLFVFNTKTGVLEMLSDVGKTIHILGWDNSENLYFTEESYNRETDESEIKSKNWNPMVGIRQIEPSNIPVSLFTSQNYDTKCLEDQNVCLDTPEQDTNGDGVVTDSDRAQVALVDTTGNIVRRIGFSQTWQAEPLLSPDKLNLIFREGSGCPPGNQEKIFITDIYGNNLRQLILFPSNNRTLTWFPNGKELAFAANRSIDADGNPSCDDESYGIYSIDVQTGSESTLTHDLRYDTIFGWSSNEQWLIIGGKNLSLVNQPGSCLQTITPAFLYLSDDDRQLVPSFAEAVMQP